MALLSKKEVDKIRRYDWPDDHCIWDLLDTLDATRRENDRLRTRVLGAAGDDLCRLTQEEIKEMSLGAVKIPPKEEFLASCERFHTQLAKEVGVNIDCPTLAQLIAENERLRVMSATLLAERRNDQTK